MYRPEGVEVVWDPGFGAYDFGPNHPFQESTRALAVALIEASGALSDPAHARRVDRVPEATEEELLRFHRQDHLERVRRASSQARAPPLDAGDTPAFPGCYEAAARIVGGAVLAAREIASGATRRAFHPAGGLHHAHPGSASGFCIFNDVATAIANLVGPGRPFGRVAYVDIDAHHGDGVMYGFYESGRVLDIDFHQDGRTLFPGTGRIDETGIGDGAGAKVNLPMPPGAGDGVLVPTFRRVVPTLLRGFRPDLIVLQHGVDGHAGDRLAGLRYGPRGYSALLSDLIGLSEELTGGRLLVTGGGGYTPRNVARVLARAGLLLAGLDGPRGNLPEEWRSTFRDRTGEDPPVLWTDPDPGPPSEGERETSERLVDALSEALGTRFPSSEPG